MKRVLLVAALLAVVGSGAVAQENVRLFVAGATTAWEFVVDPASATVTKVGTVERGRDQPFPEPVRGALKSRDDRQERLANASQLTGLPASAKWAEYSPNCQWLVLGFAHARFDIQHRVAFGRSAPWSPIGEVEVSGKAYIVDHAWSADSRYLLVVDTEERDSKSPLALLSAFAGHPVPLETLYLTAIDTLSGRKLRSKFMTDVPYGRAAFVTSEPSCNQR